MEETGKILAAFKAAALCDFLDGEGGAGEHDRGALEAATNEKLLRGDTVFFAEEASKVG